MKEKEFNLINERWIRAAKQDGSVVEVSLHELLENAHYFKKLAGEMSVQDIAVLRFLSALIHTAIMRMDMNGLESPVLEEEACFNRWKEVWEKGLFPMEMIDGYLQKWRERFWLFHQERPFYQVPEAAKGTAAGVSKLNGAVSQSNNKKRLFSQISGTDAENMTFSEGARWLIFLNSFDDCAAKQSDRSEGKKGSTVGWLGKLGLIYAIGNNLFETIMLNIPVTTGIDHIVWSEDIPTWEPEKARSMEREIITMPDNLAGLYTLQSRRILLKRGTDCITGYNLLGGDAFDDANAFHEPMTLWKKTEDTKTKNTAYKPLRHRRDRFIWQDFSSITAGDDSAIRPGVVYWCEHLRNKKILSRKRLLTFGVACVRYDSSQSGSITDCFSDDISFHSALLSETGREWCAEINNQISKINRAAEAIELLVKDLRRADGLDQDVDKAKAEVKAKANVAKERFYQEIDQLFREWLIILDEGQDSEEKNHLSLGLEEKVRRCALNIGADLIDQSGESAFIGRNLKDKKGIVLKHYSSPESYRWFKMKVFKIYPYMKGDESVEER